MRIRYHLDAESGAPHIHRHDVAEHEVEDVFGRPIEDRRGRDGSRVATGKTASGRYLRVVYVPDSEPGSVFVVTAYALGPKALWALHRRERRKR